MHDAIRIRDLEPEETETIVAIALAAWQPIFAHYAAAMGTALFAAEYPDWQASKGGQIRRAAQGVGGARVLVAEKGAIVVGFASYYLDSSTCIGEIGNNAVHPDHQGHGIGPQIHAVVLERMRAAGMQFARVHTGLDASHAPARRAYEKDGFVTAVPSVTLYRPL